MNLKESIIQYDEETGRMLTTPRQIYLEVTSYCNLKCVHCPINLGPEAGFEKHHMSLETFEKLRPWLATANCINLNCVGEPLLYPHFKQVLEACGESPAEVAFNTNGVLLSDEMCEVIVKSQTQSITISIDGTDFNDPIRGVPYSTVRDRIYALDAAKKKAGSEKPYIALAFTMMKSNAPEFPVVLREILQKADIHAVHIQPLIIFFESLRDENIYDYPDVGKVLKECREIAEQNNTLISVFRFGEQEAEADADSEEKMSQMGHKSKKYGCVDPFFEIKIKSTGKVLACSYELLTELNILDHDLDDIWNNPWYLDLRRNLRAGKFEGSCSKCPLVHGSADTQTSPLRPGVISPREKLFLEFREAHAKKNKS